MSRGNEIRPASAVNVVGAIDGDPTVLARIASGAEIVVETAWTRSRRPPASQDQGRGAAADGTTQRTPHLHDAP